MRLIEPIQRLWAATIWADGSIPDAEAKYAKPLKRVFLPAYDVLMVLGGVYAITNGIPSFEALLAPIAYGLSIGFAITGLVCLAGIALVRLWVVEAIAKCVLVGYLVVYAAALYLRGVPFTGTLMIAATILAVFRLWIIGIESGRRRDEAEAAERQGAAWK